MQTKTKLELVRRHVSKANGLPNEHYVDPYIFEEEKIVYFSIIGQA